MMIVNTPQNIPGKVYKKEELEMIAKYAKEHNFLVISDEVYEPMVYEDGQHNKIATIPGMYERTVCIFLFRWSDIDNMFLDHFGKCWEVV